MKWWIRAGIGVSLLAALAGLVAVGWVEATWRRDFSSTPFPEVRASDDPQVVARGEYLFHAVAHCSSCHADEAPAPGVPSGGPPIQAGLFGRYVPTNLTPDVETGTGSLTEAALARAIRSAVSHDGMLAPMMLIAVGPMAHEDLVAVVSYMRTLEPVRHETEPDTWGFLAKALSGRFGPRDEPVPPWVAEGEVSVARGAYLANGPAACVRCHTARDPMQGFTQVAPPFSGDAHAHPDRADPAWEIVAPNLTPDPTTGVMASWDEATFVARFRGGRALAGSSMPWESFAGLTEEDLRSLYRYLSALPPVANDVGKVRRPS